MLPGLIFVLNNKDQQNCLFVLNNKDQQRDLFGLKNLKPTYPSTRYDSHGAMNMHIEKIICMIVKIVL